MNPQDVDFLNLARVPFGAPVPQNALQAPMIERKNWNPLLFWDKVSHSMARLGCVIYRIRRSETTVRPAQNESRSITCPKLPSRSSRASSAFPFWLVATRAVRKSSSWSSQHHSRSTSNQLRRNTTNFALSSVTHDFMRRAGLYAGSPVRVPEAVQAHPAPIRTGGQVC